ERARPAGGSSPRSYDSLAGAHHAKEERRRREIRHCGVRRGEHRGEDWTCYGKYQAGFLDIFVKYKGEVRDVSHGPARHRWRGSKERRQRLVPERRGGAGTTAAAPRALAAAPPREEGCSRERRVRMSVYIVASIKVEDWTEYGKYQAGFLDVFAKYKGE